jgi:dipeptidyl aminopeptidase/acylaminoacyl peptidase
LALLGFSLGGTYSLLAAAHDPSVRAAIAYYPITNFPTWVKTHEKSWGWRMVFRAARWRYIAETPENNDVRHRELLQRSSVMAVADRIQAPTLLIHGEKDRIVPVAESQTLNTFLRERHLATELEIVPGVGHSFNFIDRQPAEDTWALTLGWLVRYLGPPPVAAATRATTQAPSWHR